MFNLADVLKNVPNSGTNDREQIEYLHCDQISADANNFYAITNIDELAANIELCGLQQPIRVRRNGEGYTIVSGHRRFAAIQSLGWEEVPCIVEQDDASHALQQLRLIYANSATRQMTSAELSEQAVQVEHLLYALQEQGYEFPGRMRDHVAQAVNASKSKLSRLKVIREHLIPQWQEQWKSNAISEDTALKLAQQRADIQTGIYTARCKPDGSVKPTSTSTVDNIVRSLDHVTQNVPTCNGQPCTHVQAKIDASMKLDSYSNLSCTGDHCCRGCHFADSCRHVCEKVLPEVKARKAEKRAQENARKEAEQAVDDAMGEISRRVNRVIRARAKALGLTDAEALASRLGCKDYHCKDYFRPETELNYGRYTTPFPGMYSLHGSDIQRLIAIADALDISLDELFGRKR